MSLSHTSQPSHKTLYSWFIFKGWKIENIIIGKARQYIQVRLTQLLNRSYFIVTFKFQSPCVSPEVEEDAFQSPAVPRLGPASYSFLVAALPLILQWFFFRTSDAHMKEVDLREGVESRYVPENPQRFICGLAMIKAWPD